jgi:hypothetical protein
MDLVKLFLTLIGFFVPPDPAVTDWVPPGHPDLVQRAEASMKEIRMWYWKVSGTVFLLAAGLVYTLFFAGFVRASDVETLAQSQKTLAQAVNDQLAVSTADNICRLIQRRSKETNESERWRLRTDIDELQKRYRVYSGTNEYYPEQRCLPAN